MHQGKPSLGKRYSLFRDRVYESVHKAVSAYTSPVLNFSLFPSLFFPLFTTVVVNQVVFDMMLLSTFDDSLPPFLPLEEDQLGRSTKDHQWSVKFNEDAPLVPVQPIFHSTFDDMLPSLLLSGRRQLDASTENDLWPTHSDEPGMQTDDEPGLFDWLQWPELADVTFNAKSDVTDEEILCFYDELSNNQAPSLLIAQNEGISISVTRPQTPSNENEKELPHATTFEHSPRSVHQESTEIPYLQGEIEEVVKILVVMVLVLGQVVSDNYTPPAGQECEDTLQYLGDHMISRDGHPQEGSRLVHDRKRKRKGDPRSDQSPKQPKHHAPPSQVQRHRHECSATVRFDFAIYLGKSSQQQTFRWARRGDNDMKWNVREARYEYDVLNCFLYGPGQPIDICACGGRR
ncbi:hypothetical protein NPX13_g11036 [Xylaria arbuscula]|uniref:Uncharacterized protein n=1 Tax=Xylaria arbuscula TaxID=114810 RepID=A0A9W8N3L0_9PEZI|nr:hypothetical protein NPX13_g11036 [Xylaria arbuscula]